MCGYERKQSSNYSKRIHGEKIDIIKWTEDLPTLISESLSPAEIQRVSYRSRK